MFTARLNGMQFSGNVGDDAHIVPLRGEPPAEWGRLFYPVPFNVPIGSGGFGSMEGIDPYIETGGATHSTYRSVP